MAFMLMFFLPAMQQQRRMYDVRRNNSQQGKTENGIRSSLDLEHKWYRPQRYVVTAAHCLYDGSNQLTVKGGAKFRVMIGEHDHCKHNEVRTS